MTRLSGGREEPLRVSAQRSGRHHSLHQGKRVCTCTGCAHACVRRWGRVDKHAHGHSCTELRVRGHRHGRRREHLGNKVVVLQVSQGEGRT